MSRARPTRGTACRCPWCASRWASRVREVDRGGCGRVDTVSVVLVRYQCGTSDVLVRYGPGLLVGLAGAYRAAVGPGVGAGRYSKSRTGHQIAERCRITGLRLYHRALAPV